MSDATQSREPFSTPAKERAVGRRLWFYRNERRLIRVYFLFLVLLNLLPVGWILLNWTSGIESEIERDYSHEFHRVQRQADDLLIAGEEEAASSRLRELLGLIGDAQLRSKNGRLRTDVLAGLGALELDLGLNEEALAHFEIQQGIDPNDFRGWTGAGLALLELGQTEEALTSLEASLAMFPNQPDVVNALLETHFEAGRRERLFHVLDDYLDAVWATEARLYFDSTWPCLKEGKRNYIQFPVVLDGKSHTYRLFPGSGRRPYERELAHAGAIGQLRLVIVDEPHVLIDFEQHRCLGSSPWPEKPTVLDQSRKGRGWTPTHGLDDWGAGRFLSTSASPRMARQVSLRGEDVESIELKLTLHKPVSSAMHAQVALARKQLGRAPDDRPRLPAYPTWDAPPEKAKPISEGSGDAFSFAIAGHVRKTSKDKNQIQDSLRADIKRIGRVDQALVLTGDFVWSGTKKTFDQLDQQITAPAGIPVFVAVGNHDCHGTGRTVFEERYGSTWKLHTIGRSRFLILDTEHAKGDISGEQLAFAEQAIADASKDEGIDHLFVFMHRALWFPKLAEFSPILSRANKSTRSLAEDPKSALNFMGTLVPRMAELATEKSVWCFAGDIGTRLPMAYAAHQGIHLVASGNKAAQNNWWNHYLRVIVEGPSVELHVIPLGGVGLEAVQTYTPSYWAEREGLPKPCSGN
ncbi:MAG: tetratricopeptide (TPR) repeat protein [Planctomycetota bacterium]|jgi:tetratricopeptide (TPR) repeat protein